MSPRPKRSSGQSEVITASIPASSRCCRHARAVSTSSKSCTTSQSSKRGSPDVQLALPRGGTPALGSAAEPAHARGRVDIAGHVVSATANDGRCQVKAFVTGGTGFIGGRVARRLRERGDEVVALVRSPAKAAELRELGCELVEGDLSSERRDRSRRRGLRRGVPRRRPSTRSGSPTSEREAMRDANVRGTERVLDAAIEAGVPRIVYVSTVGVFGNTHGKVVDETYERNGGEFLSCYEETKCRVASGRARPDREGRARRDRAARRRLRARRPLRARQHHRPGAHRQAEDADVPRDGLQPRARRRRRGRHPARTRQGARWASPTCSAARSRRCATLIEKVAEIAGPQAAQARACPSPR